MGPKLDLVDACIATGRRAVTKRLPRLGKKPDTRSLVYRRLLKARQRIDAHLDEPLSVPTLARAAALSEHHFNRLFKSAFEVSPHRYLKERRLLKARRLLETTGLPVLDVALSVGYESAAAFSAAVRQAFGVTPTALRGPAK